ncbi:unnamed protein product [Caenorhabditis nigoni]
MPKEKRMSITHHLDQCRVQKGRIVSPSGYEPQEVSLVMATQDPPNLRVNHMTRGLLTKRRRQWMELTQEHHKDWKQQSYFMSDDSELCGFVSESIGMGHEKDVIQIESMLRHEAVMILVLDGNHLHGPVILQNPHSHFRFSPANNRKFLYFAQPNEQQKRTKCGKERHFVIGIYDFETQKTAVITDESVCTRQINAVLWTPDSKGIIFHSDGALYWYRFGELYVNKIFAKMQMPIGMAFSPDHTKLAVFLPYRPSISFSIVLFMWPFVRAAVTFQHEVISLGDYRIWCVPERPWANDSKSIIFNANHQTEMVNFSICTETLKVRKFQFPRPALILDVQNDEMLFETVSANSFSRLWISDIASVETSGPEETFQARLVTSQRPELDEIYNFEVKTVHFDGGYSGILYMCPESHMPGQKLPLVVVPHAGWDHNMTIVSVEPILCTMVNAGMCVLVVNYRQPIPPGADLHYMKHQNTRQQAKDVHEAVKQVLREHPRLDEDYVVLFGQQYGTYVCATILYDEPEFYACVAFLNPIVELLVQNGQISVFPRPFEIPLFCLMRDRNTYGVGCCELLVGAEADYVEEYEADDPEYHDIIVRLIRFLKDPEWSELKDRPPTPAVTTAARTAMKEEEEPEEEDDQ